MLTNEEWITPEKLLQEFGEQVMNRYPFKEKENTCWQERQLLREKRERYKKQIQESDGTI